MCQPSFYMTCFIVKGLQKWMLLSWDASLCASLLCLTWLPRSIACQDGAK